MKTSTQETTCKCSVNQRKTGFLQTVSLGKILHINQTAQPTQNLAVRTSQREEDRRVQEMEALLRRDTARAYAGINPLK